MAILCLAGLFSLATIFQAGKLCLAWYWGCSNDVSEQLRGANLLPGDAEAWDRLGQAVQWNFDAPNPSLAVSYYRKAVADDPRSADNWLNLANAYEAIGNAAEASSAYEAAQRDYPISADVAWKYGNFLVRQGQTTEGLRQIHAAIATDPKLTPLAISQMWTFDHDANVILTDILPPDPAAFFQALDFFSANRDTSAAMIAWDRIIALPRQHPLDLKRSFPFLDSLIAQGDTADIRRVWRQVLSAAGWDSTPPEDGSLVWNGGFESPIADGGLGWRIQQTPGAYISVDAGTAHSGTHSLRVDFSGGMNLDFYNVQEFVPVQPSSPYVFQAFLRTEAISTESGIGFEILDQQHKEVNVLTPSLTGTNPWTPVQANILTGPDTKFLWIRLRRFPSKRFDNKLGGTVWIDDVTLVPRAAAADNSRP
ncbi:MAG TPA: tetratricopeptide repeat protein [Candidatus Acidoferrales bacterium]|nr:tetratricopeptide repeat protein [Candidatus Acidoferrales bacterium]